MKASQLCSFASFAVAVLINLPTSVAQPPGATAPTVPAPAPAAEPVHKLPADAVIKPGKADIDLGPLEWNAIPVRYVKASYIAYWLDPANQPEPADFIQSRRIQELAGQKLPGFKGQGVPVNLATERPKGVASLVAADDERTLFALTTPNGAKNMQTILSFLDRPVRTISIEANLVQMDDNELEKLGIEFTKNALEKQNNLGFVRGDREEQVEKLLRDGRGRILASYQFSARNSQANGDTAILVAGPKANGAAPANETVCSLAITPTVNSDDSITMTISLAAALRSPAGQNSKPPQVQPSFSVTSIANVSNGDTLLLGGLAFGETSVLAEGVEPNPAPQKNVFLLIKARVLEGGRVL